MSAEDRLRDMLRDEAQSVVPAGDGLARIQARVARRRRMRIWLIPSAAVTTAGAVLAFLVLAPADRTTQTLVPTSPSPSAPSTATPGPSPTTPPVPVGSYSGPAIWPITSQAEADAWDEAWAESGLEVGRRFVRDHLKLTDVTLRQDCLSCEVLAVVSSDLKDIATLVLAHYTVGEKHLFTVVSVEGTDLKVSTPKQGAAVSSPLSVSGTIEGVDESIRVTLLDGDGGQVAQAFAAAGSGAPWRTTLEWSDRTWDDGALVLRTGNARDGATNRLVVLAVTQGSAPAGSTFAALVDGHVSLYDGTTGALVRQLTFPPKGKRDVEAAWDGESVLWARQGTDSGCGGEIDLRTLNETKTLHSATSFRYRHPQLSGDGSLLGWVEEPCDTSPYTLVIEPRPIPGVAAPARRIEGPTGSLVGLLDLRDDGAALVLTNDREPSGPGTIGYLAPGAERLDGLTPIAPEPGCYLTHAAFDGDRIAGFQACEDGIQLVRWTTSGPVSSKDRAMQDEDPESISIRDGRVLVWRFGGDTVGEIATYADGRFTTLITPDPAHCTSIADQKGCVKSPDW